MNIESILIPLEIYYKFKELTFQTSKVGNDFRLPFTLAPLKTPQGIYQIKMVALLHSIELMLC